MRNIELNEIIQFVKNIRNNGEFSTKVITLTTPSWAKTTNNPYVIIRKEGRKVVERIERVQKLTYYNNNIMIGGNYINQVSTEITRNGANKEEWQAEGMKGFEWEMFPYILKGVKNIEQKYIRFTMRKTAPKPSVIYLLDGKIVTKEEVIENIKSWQKPHYNSLKQGEFGIEEERQVRPLNVKSENIVFLAQSGNKIGDDTLVSLFTK